MKENKKKIIFLGNFGKGHQSNCVFDKKGIASTLTTMRGGNVQPMIIIKKKKDV